MFTVVVFVVSECYLAIYKKKKIFVMIRGQRLLQSPEAAIICEGVSLRKIKSEFLDKIKQRPGL